MTGERVRIAREIAQLTQEKLAELVGMDQVRIHRIETGQIALDAATRERLQWALGFPADFFTRPIELRPPVGSLGLFRAPKQSTAMDREKFRNYGLLAAELFIFLSGGQRAVQRLPLLPNDDPVVAAQVTRNLLGLDPYAPIKNMTNLLERSGAVVLGVPVAHEELRAAFQRHEPPPEWKEGTASNRISDRSEVDGYSFSLQHQKEHNIIVYRSNLTCFRQRLTLAHELGHLVLGHLKGVDNNPDKEADAWRFAGEMLFPEKAVRDFFKPPVSLMDCVRAKAQWKISIQAILQRLRETEAIGPRQISYLWAQLQQRGWRRNEPLDDQVASEAPQLLKRHMNARFGDTVDLRQVAYDLSFPVGLVSDLIYPEKSERDKQRHGEKVSLAL